jgi:hypothetical protein
MFRLVSPPFFNNSLIIFHLQNYVCRLSVVPLVPSDWFNNQSLAREYRYRHALLYAQRDEMELSSSLEQAQILPQRRLDPSLRMNSGPLPFYLGEGVNRERSALPNNGGILPLVTESTSLGENPGEQKGRKIFLNILEGVGRMFME